MLEVFLSEKLKCPLRSKCLGPGQDMSSHPLGPGRHSSAPKAVVFLKDKKKRDSLFSKDPRQIIKGLMPGTGWEMDISGNVIAPPNLWMTPCSGPEVSCKTADPNTIISIQIHADNSQQWTSLPLIKDSLGSKWDCHSVGDFGSGAVTHS